MGGNEVCLLAIERPTSGSSLSWRVCIDKYEQRGDLLLAKTFRDIEAHDNGEKLLRATTGLFVPHDLAEAISQREDNYASRTSPFLIDVVLPRFMERDKWIQLSHQQGYGVDSHRVWKSAQSFQDIFPVVELVNCGDKMAFYHYGTDREYHKLLASVGEDPRLNSLAYAAAGVQWYKRQASQLTSSG